MSISKEEVKHVARLSRLEFEEKELKEFTEKFASVIDYVEKLKEVDCTGVKPTYHPHPNLRNVMREDKVKDSLDRDDIMKNAPDNENGYIKIPKVLE